MEKTNVVITVIGIIVLAGLIYVTVIAGLASSARGEEYGTFAQCLEEQGAVFWGASWCPRCAEQKSIFGSGAKYLPYFECSLNGSRTETVQACQDEFITSYPTWRFTDGEQCAGVVAEEILSEKTGCALPNIPNVDRSFAGTYERLIVDSARRVLQGQVHSGVGNSVEAAAALDTYLGEVATDFEEEYGYSIEDGNDPADLARFLAARVCVNIAEHKAEQEANRAQFELNQNAIQVHAEG